MIFVNDHIIKIVISIDLKVLLLIHFIIKIMKRLIKSSLLIIFIINLSSCVLQTPIETVKPVNNNTYNVQYLFEHNGCKVYRFMDLGHYVYFTNCNSDVTSIENDSIHTRVINVNKISK